MSTLQDHINAYAAYHQDHRNKLTHFVGVPLVTFGIFLFFAWFRFVAAPTEVFMSGASLFYLCVFIYYLTLDWFITLVQFPITIGLLYVADWVARWPSFEHSLIVFLV